MQSANELIKAILSNTINSKFDAPPQKHPHQITNTPNTILKKLPPPDKEINNIYNNNETNQKQNNHNKNTNLEN